jgi:short subunit dehydrogenase-like uncharacterized protein
MKSNTSWLIYGASGYTGGLLARAATARGMRPTLAGRSRESVESLGKELGCETRTMSLDDPYLARSLEGFGCVLLAAGPFSRTSSRMLAACSSARCHYLDLAGELEVIGACYASHFAACAAGIAVIPAVGFSVVPMDCVAVELATAIECPVALELAFEGYELSPGTAKTYAEAMALGTARRVNGRLERAPLSWELVPIPFKSGTQQALRVPYGELVSCHRSTGIANVSTFMVPHPALERLLKYGSRFAPLLRFAWAKRLSERFADRCFRGPDEASRRRRRTRIWGRISSADGSRREAFLETPEPYQLSVATALSAVERVLAGSVRPGAWTPSQAFGANFITEVGGCTLELGRPTRGPANSAELSTS